MKNIKLLIIILLIFNSFLYSQSLWEYENTSGKVETESIYNMVELSDGNILSITFKHLSLDNIDENKNYTILRIHDSQTGKVIKQRTFKYDNLSTYLYWIFYNKEDESFVIAGGAHRYLNSDRIGYFVSTYWNKDLNLKFDTLIPLAPVGEPDGLWNVNGFINKNNDIIVLGNYSTDLKNVIINRKLLLAKLDKYGRILNLSMNNKNFKGYYSTIVNGKDPNTYMLFSFKSLILNEGFEIIDSINNYNLLIPEFSTTVTKFSDSLYLSTIDLEGNTQQGLGLFDSKANLIKMFNINSEGDEENINWRFGRKNFDYIDTSEIFTGDYEYKYDYFTIAKVNSNLDPYWIKYFSLEDSIGHFINSILATKDGGFVLCGLKGDYVGLYEYFPFNYTSWIQKFDSDGNTVSITEPSPNIWSITVYPNPSSGEFSINIKGKTQDTKLELYDIQGKIVKRFSSLIQGKNRLDMYDIPHGIYVWQLSRDGKILGTGKWVKE